MSAGTATGAETDRPNVLVFLADQHRADCIGACGNPDVQTPNLDALASGGVLYRNAFCPFPVCTPSRYSLLSGLYVREHLGWTNHCTLPAGLPTFARVFRDAGYATAAVGKMHFTPTYLDAGFDRMLLAEQNGPGRYDDDYHRHLRDEGLCDGADLVDQEWEYRRDATPDYWGTLGAAESDLDEAHHSTTWIGDRVLEVLADWGDGGNLLMAGFIKPHHPFDPPAPWSRMYDPAALTLLPGWSAECLPADLAYNRGYFPHDGWGEAQLRRAMAMYYATISQLDFQIGRALALLKARGLDRNTIVVYTGDHGDYMGFHHLLLKGNHMYDPLARVPLIVRAPGRAAGADSVSDSLVSLVDVAPTLLGAAGLEPPAGMHGLDLLAEPDGREAVFAESGREYMVRTRDRKLLLNRDREHCLFFDLERDPHELANLYAAPARAGEVAELRERLLDWLAFGGSHQPHLDEAAPLAPAANAITPNDPRHAELEQYFHAAMAARG